MSDTKGSKGSGRDHVISADKLCLTFDSNDGPVHALKDVDLTIEKGDFVSFIGPSGCGKTTLLRVIADLENPTSGSITVNGMTPEEARLQRAYGYVFQAPALLAWRTIERNVGLPLEIMGLSAAEKAARVARALAFDADLLLMDEPFGALDEIVRDHLNEQLLQLWNKTGKTICFVTHSIPEAVYLSNKIVVMSPRPGRVTDVIESDLPADRPLDIRESKKFLEIAQRVRTGLREGHSYE